MRRTLEEHGMTNTNIYFDATVMLVYFDTLSVYFDITICVILYVYRV